MQGYPKIRTRPGTRCGSVGSPALAAAPRVLLRVIVCFYNSSFQRSKASLRYMFKSLFGSVMSVVINTCRDEIN